MSVERNQPEPGRRLEFRTARLSDLRPYAGNARTHSPEQLERLRDSIARFGFIAPAVALPDGTLVAGHGRTAAASLAGLEEVPVVFLHGYSIDEARAYCLADNRLADLAGWDESALAVELSSLEGDLLSSAGFNADEVEDILSRGSEDEPPPTTGGEEGISSEVCCPRCRHRFDLSEG